MIKANNALFRKIQDYCCIASGSIILAFAVIGFMSPNQLISGGFTGISIILNHLFGIPIGLFSLFLMGITFFAGLFVLGSGFGGRSIFATVIFTSALDIFDKVIELGPITNNLTLAVFYGGIISGASMALIFYSGSSTGGSDTLAAIIKKYTGIPIGKALFGIDLAITLSAGFIFGAEPLMYSFILIFISSQVIDLVLNGIKSTKKMWIISKKWEEIQDLLITEYNRGVTLFEGIGGFTGEKRNTLISYVPRKDVNRLRRQIHAIDPDVFISVENSSGVFGNGFRHPKYD